MRILRRSRRPQAVPDNPQATPPLTAQNWFNQHYEEAAGEVIRLFAGADISLEGKRVADVGCGDGIIDLGVARAAHPAQLTGFDLNRTDTDHLLRTAHSAGVSGPLPECLEFRTCEEERLPAEDDSFDFMFSWSAFEHIAKPIEVIREMRRILRPEGVLMIQVWPFLASQHGDHLWPWFPNGFAHQLHGQEYIDRYIRENSVGDAEMAGHFAPGHLNGVGLDDLQRALLAGGFRVARVELITHSIDIPEQLSHQPLSLMSIAGVKLLAAPARTV